MPFQSPGSYDVASQTSLTAVKAKTDNLPASPANEATLTAQAIPGNATSNQIWPTGTTTGTNIENNGNAEYGNWQEFVAANAITADFYIVAVFLFRGTIKAGSIPRVQIGTGGAGSETVLVSDIPAPQGATTDFMKIDLYEKVAANTRVTARWHTVAGVGTPDSCSVIMQTRKA